MNAKAAFCRQVRARSVENALAVSMLHKANLPGKVVSVLREELDSLVRVIFLLSVKDRDRRVKLMAESVTGRGWKCSDSGRRITDRGMVDLAQRLHGWTKSVYSFGCAFIHLSGFHDYRERDPMTQISDEERTAILKHMRHYHGGPPNDDASFADLSSYLPMVFEKITENLECYVKALETDRDLSDF